MPVAKPKPKAEAPKTLEREVLYPEVVTELKTGPDAINEDWAKKVLGWESVLDDGEFLSTDENGVKFRCTNNTHNRPYERTRAEQYAQAVLMRQWSGPNGNGKTINGESIVIGKTGECLSLQHRLTGLIFACQEWEKNDRWRTKWETKPVMDALVVYGIDEDAEVTMTIDNVKPRSAADNFYADSTIFPGEKSADRKQLCKLIEYAVRGVWQRSGGKQDAYAPYFVHTEAKDFLNRHPKLMDCVKHIWKQDGDRQAVKNNVIGLGTASAIMYLQGCSATKPDKYRGTPDNILPQSERNEEVLDWSMWDRAWDFWVEITKPRKEMATGFKLLVDGIGDLSGMDGEGGGTRDEKTGMLAKAWGLYADEQPMTLKTLGYEYEEFIHPVSKEKLKRMKFNGLTYDPPTGPDKKLIEHLSFGGIDYGDPEAAARDARAAEKAAQDEARKNLKEAEKALKDQAKQVPTEDLSTALTRIRQTFTAEILLWQGTEGDAGVGGFVTWGSDALRLAKLYGGSTKPELVKGLQCLQVGPDKVDALSKLLSKKGVEAIVCGIDPKTKTREARGKYYDAGFLPFPEGSPTPTDPLPRVASKAKPLTGGTIEERKAEVRAEGLAEKAKEAPPKVKTPSTKAPSKALKGGIGSK
jgi:hypothetical protein